MAAIEPKGIEQDDEEMAIDLTDPNSVAENLDSLSEEQIETLLQKALDINKKLKSCLPNEERRKVKLNEERSRQFPSKNEVDLHGARTVLPPIRKSPSLVAKDEVMKDLRHTCETMGKVRLN